MKRKFLVCILVLITIFFITGCGNKKVQKQEENKEKEKIVLKLQHLDLKLEPTQEDIEYEKTMVIENENVNISGINHQNIDKGMLNDYQDKYKKVIEFIQKKYPEFDLTKWSIVVNMFAVSDGNGIIKLNYQIKDEIDTNKSIVFTINNNVISLVSFINMDFEVDEEKLLKFVTDFKNSTIQEKRVFKENEEFYKDEVTYSYHYNVDELRYTYQLYFYMQYGDNPENKVINNEYGTEYVINKNKMKLAL